ncbi:MAG TPA: hypothetical protein PLU54_10190 [Deltaproteobacteria bacterium]|nr:hypothetical protein [Deltaproteobacteria bacterium]
MQIRTYTAVSMKDALTQIKSELGSNAVIISTREIKESGYGLMSKPLIEVVAAVDYDSDTFIKKMQGKNAHSGTPEARNHPAPPLPVSGHIGDEIVELKKMLKHLMSQSKVAPYSPLRDKLLAGGVRESIVDLILSKLGDGVTEDKVKNLLSRLLRVEAPTNSGSGSSSAPRASARPRPSPRWRPGP